MDRVLVILSEYGYWGEELIGPLEVLENAGIVLDFATPNGKKPHALPPSMDPEYVDPPLNKSVVSREIAQKVRAIDSSPRLDHPISLKERLPERPYLSSPNYLREVEAYNLGLEKANADWLGRYAALLIVGGSGPLVDLVNNRRVHDVILEFHRADKPIAAECYGVACLAFARDYDLRRSILTGKRVTGHPLEYDYKDGTGFYGVDFNMGPPPFPLEFILRDAVGPEGEFIGNVGKSVSVIVDYPFITGRSTPDSYKTGEMLVEALHNGLRRYGF